MRTKNKSLEYLINLTVALVGSDILESFSDKDIFDPSLRPMVKSILKNTVEPKVRRMTPETLGRICAAGDTFLVHDNKEETEFIWKTGVSDILSNVDIGLTMPNVEILQKLAVAVIVGVAIDVVRQPHYQISANAHHLR